MASSSSGHNNFHSNDDASFAFGFKEQKMANKHNEQNGGSGAGPSSTIEFSNGATVVSINGANGHFSRNKNGFGNNESLEEGDETVPPFEFTSGQRDILRVIGQHLRLLGLHKTTEALIRESGCMLEHPIASTFCSLIMNGLWDQAERALDSLKPIMEDSSADFTVSLFLIQ